MRYLTCVVAFLLTSCSITGISEEAQVEFQLYNNSEYEGELPVRIHFSTHANPTGEKLLAANFSGPEGYKPTGPFETASSGSLLITVELLNSEANAVTAGKIKLPLKSDWIYGITVGIGPRNPERVCFGCQGSKAIPINSDLNFSPRDTLFIVWGGNSISNPVIY